MNKAKRCYIDIHVMQTVPPSCVNRDDTGSPKTAVYGGVTRARVSSQAWKRAIRQDFRDCFAPEQLGSRTKKVLDRVVEELLKLEPSLSREQAEKKAEKVLQNAGISLNKKLEADALFFMSNAQAKALAALASGGTDDKDACKAALKDNPSIDQALFGRMVASDPSLNYDAAAQVAHAISTHAVQNEFDYYTAVDDCAPEDNAGAGHIGTTEFNSATLYRYATLNVDELARWLGGETVDAVKGFVESFCCAMPTGKQNSFANRTMPDAVYVTVRNDQPINFSGAFEKPVRAGADGYLGASEQALAEYASKTYSIFAPAPACAFASSRGEAFSSIAERLPLRELLERVGVCVAARLAGGELK